MPRTIARRRFSSRPVPQRRMVWARGGDALVPVTFPDAGNVDLLSDFRTAMGITANLPGTTITRVRFTVQADYTGVTVDGQQGMNLGIIVGEQLTDTDTPHPGDDPMADWMYWEWIPVSEKGAAIAGPIVSARVDVKSQRRLDEIQQTLRFAFAPSGTDAVNAVDFTVQWSVLLKLP